jgi:hypothetical protein
MFVLTIKEGRAASKSPLSKFGYFLSSSQQAVSSDIIPNSAVGIFKGLVAGCHSFCLFFIFYNIHTFIHPITFILYIYPSPFAGASLHFFIACELSGKNLPVVPSRESNSGLPAVRIFSPEQNEQRQK